MAIHKLGDRPDLKRLIKTAKTHSDGGGLYLVAKSAGSGSWVSRVERAPMGQKWKGLGGCDEVDAETARELHRVRKMAYRAGAVIGDRHVAVAPPAASDHEPVIKVPAQVSRDTAPVKGVLFRDVVEAFLVNKAASFTATSAEPIRFRELAAGSLGQRWVGEIDQNDIAADLLARWGHAIPTAWKQQRKFREVMGYAIAAKLHPGPNPADAAIMKHLLPKAPEVTAHPAMALEAVPALMRELAADGSGAARALAFTIVAAARTGEARGARWEEIDGDVLTVPAVRMKGKVGRRRPHSIPLTPCMTKLFGTPQKSGLIFGSLNEKHLDNLLKKLRGPGATVHGMRSVFVGWAKRQGYSEDLREAALAHVAGDATVSAYDRERLVEERRPMMQAWCDYLTKN